jgi:hypothetical protein
MRSGVGTPDALRQALMNAGQPVQSFESVLPSLEDVFLDMVDRLERERAA